MYRLLISFLMFSFLTPAFAASRTIVTQSPYYYNPNFNHGYARPHWNNGIPPQRHPHCHNCSSFSDINALENYILNRNYARESDLQRLERLEMQAFGALQSGDINTRYDNVRSAILSRPKQNYRTSLLRNIGNYFGGQMTGYTPSMGSSSPFGYTTSSFSPYPTTYGNSSITEYSSPFGGRGYTINNYSTGSNAGVRILD